MTKARCRAMLGALPISTEAAPMPTVQSFPAGGYRFISHQFQYSGGVAAEPGFRVERARFARPLPLAEGFDAIEAGVRPSRSRARRWVGVGVARMAVRRSRP